MGVRGLESFIEKDCRGCKQVDIEETVARYRGNSQEPVVVVVDTCSCLGKLYGPLPWIPGGQLKEYRQVVEKLVERFRALGVEPVFFFDGSLRDNKVPTWIKRKTEALERIDTLFDNIKNGRSVQDIEKKNIRMLLVDNLDRLTIDVLKSVNCKVFNSILECDVEIVKFASDNNCMAVLGRDSDFLIYPGSWRYWSSKHFDLNSMKTKEYDRQRLVEYLGIPRVLLPLWASLMGNDVLHYDEIQYFHGKLRRKKYKGHQALLIARYLNDRCRPCHGNGLSAIRNEFSNPRVSRLLEESVESYDVAHQDLSVYRIVDSNIRCPEDDNWDKILQIVVENHKNNDFPSLIFGIMVRQNYKCSEYKEDYRNKDLPPNQKVLKKLRQKMYGILLREKPCAENSQHVVKELAVAGPGTFDHFDDVEPIPPSVHHPGLLNLWNDGGNMDDKWNLLCSCIDVDSSEVRGVIPDEYIIPTLSLLYIVKEGVQLEKWEAQAVVASFVTLDSYSTEKLRETSVTRVDPRSVHFYTLVTRSFFTVYNLNVVCGFPVPREKICFSLFQDGKLFQVKYDAAKQGVLPEELCENMDGALTSFQNIMNLLPFPPV